MANETAHTQLKATEHWYQNQLSELTRFIELTGDKAKEESQKAVQSLAEKVTEEMWTNPRVQQSFSDYKSSLSDETGRDLAEAISETVQSIYDLRWRAKHDEWLLTGYPYSTSIVSKMALVYGIILLEEMIKEYDRLVLQRTVAQAQLDQQTRDMMKNKAGSLDLVAILGIDSIEELIEIVIEKQTDGLGRKSIDKMATHFKNRYNIHLADVISHWDALRKAYYTRNLVVHNRGVMNRQVHDRIQLCSVGESVTIDETLVAEMVDALNELNTHLYNAVSVRFAAVGENPEESEDKE